MSHKIVIKFEAVKNANQIVRDTWVAAIWHLLAVADETEAKRLHDASVPKGFVWHVTQDNAQDENVFLMEFSCIRPELVEMMKKGAEIYRADKTAYQLSGDIILRIKDYFDVNDPFLSSGCLRLAPVTGMILDRSVKAKKRKDNDEPGPKRISLNPYADQIAFCRRLKHNLLLKAKLLLGENYEPKDIGLRIISSGTEEAMPFRGIPLRGHLCSVQLVAPKPVLEIALYAGLGRMNGLGFGMMTTMKKATA